MSEPIEDQFDEEGGDYEEMMDPLEALGSFLSTEEGETVADSLSMIAKQMEKTNLILIKILTALSAKPPVVA